MIRNRFQASENSEKKGTAKNGIYPAFMPGIFPGDYFGGHNIKIL